MIRHRHPLLVALFAFLLPGLFALAVGGPRISAQPRANEDIVINEVYYRGVNSGEDWIELRNTGTGSIDIGNWWFCARFDYERVGLLTIVSGDDYILTPGEILVVRPWTDLDDNASDLGLYIDGNFFSTSSMVDFVQWGSGGSIGRANVAVAKGIWRQIAAGQFDFVAGATGNQSIAWTGLNSGGGLLTHSQDWSAGTPSQGLENPPPAATSTPTVTPTATATVATSTPTATATPTATPTGTTTPQKLIYLPLVVRN